MKNSATLRTSSSSGTGAPSPTVPNHHVALPTPSPNLNQSTSSSNNNALDHHTHSADGDGVGSYNRRSHNDDNNDNNITLVSSATSAGVAIDFNTASAASNNSIPTFAVKDVVDVASRTGPGMNKHGGSARITKVHASGAGVDVIYTYDVKYIIGGGREKHLDQQYISLPIPDEIKAQAKTTRGDRTSAKILAQSTVSSSRPSERCVKKRKTQERQPLSSNTPSMEVENFDTPTSYQTTAGLRTVSVDEPSDTSPDIPPTTSTTATNGIVDETEELQDPDYDDGADEYKEILPKEKKKKKKKKGLKSCKCDDAECPYCSPSYSYDSQSDTDDDGSSDYEDSASDDDGTPFERAHEHEGKKETTKKSPTGHTTSKTANNNEQNSFSKCITGQTNGSVGVPPFPTMKSTSAESTSAEKRKKRDVGDEEAMTTKKRMKAPPSKSGGLTGRACEEQMSVINMDDSDDEAVNDDSSFDRSSSFSAKGKSSASASTTSIASDGKMIIELLDSDDDEQVNASVAASKPSSLPSVKGSVSHSHTASAKSKPTPSSKQSSTVKKSKDSQESTAASKPSPEFDFSNDSSDDDSSQPSRDSSKTFTSKQAATSTASSLSENDDLSRLQSISNHCHVLLSDQNFDPESAKRSTFKHGNKSITVPIYSNDREELIEQIRSNRDFAIFVSLLRIDKDYGLHYESAEILIYYELAERMAPAKFKALFRITVVLKCPKHKELANGENIETGDTNDPSSVCPSVDSKDVIESSFPTTFIRRGTGNTAQYINARQLCIKDPSPESCGCLDWQLRERKWGHRTLIITATYHQSIKTPSLLICFGGESALKLVKEFNEKGLFTAFNAEYGPHLCTLVCWYGYSSIAEQLRAIYEKVQSISLTTDRFFRNIASRNPSFQTPPKTMLTILCESDKTPMVNKPTKENIKMASEADSKRRGELSKKSWTQERKDDLSELSTDRWADPESRKKMVEGIKKSWKLSEARTIERNPVLSEGHYTKVPARKTKLKDEVDDQNEKVFACKYCVCAFDKNEIKRYRSYKGGWQDPNNR
eukprot:scaffold16574_cov139-Skeletonema_dohrnii-CCMP3373.AAC.2